MLYVMSHDKIAKYLNLSHSRGGINDLKLFCSTMGIGDLKVPRNIGGVEDLKLDLPVS